MPEIINRTCREKEVSLKIIRAVIIRYASSNRALLVEQDRIRRVIRQPLKILNTATGSVETRIERRFTVQIRIVQDNPKPVQRLRQEGKILLHRELNPFDCG